MSGEHIYKYKVTDEDGDIIEVKLIERYCNCLSMSCHDSTIETREEGDEHSSRIDVGADFANLFREIMSGDSKVQEIK